MLPKENVRQFRGRVRKMQHDFAIGVLDFPPIYQRLMSWVGHARQADTYRLRSRLLDTIYFQRAASQ